MYFIIMEKKQTGLILLTLSVILTLTTSGCTLPGGTTAGQGVIIENFEVDFPRVFAGEKFKLQMRMRNEGSIDAYNVYPKLYNIGTSFQNDMLEISCQHTCGQGVNLLAPDPDRGTIGESRTCIWDCVAPTGIPKGLSVTFNPSVRLYYWYGTHTIKSITVASQDELRSLQSQGKSPPSETVSTTGGPVQMDIVVQGPIRYWEGEQRITFPININIQNTGGGTTCITSDVQVPLPFGFTTPSFSYVTMTAGCENPDNWNKIRLYFDDLGGSVNLYCTPGQDQQDIFELWKGQSTTITCEVDMVVPAGPSPGFIQKNLKFYIDYAYFLDRTVGIEVVGRDIQQF
jgi:hypothetical protein